MPFLKLNINTSPSNLKEICRALKENEQIVGFYLNCSYIGRHAKRIRVYKERKLEVNYCNLRVCYFKILYH